MRTRVVAGLLGLALVLSACGTTAEDADGATDGPAAGEEEETTGDAGTATATDGHRDTEEADVDDAGTTGGDTAAGDDTATEDATSGDAATGTASNDGAGDTTGEATTGDATTGEDTGAHPVSGSGYGYTDDTINIGIQIVSDTEAGFEAVGAGAVAPDEQAIADTMVEWINQTGGLAGRQVNPIYHETSATSGTWASQAQAACATFNEDNDVVAVVSSATGGSDALWACLSEEGTPLVERNVWMFDDPYYVERPDTLYTPFAMSPNRAMVHWVDGLEQLDYFEGASLGLMRFDGQPFERITEEVVKPRLATHGVEVVDEAVITSPPSIAAFGNMAGEINNALVRFRSRGITHIIMVENAGIMPFFLLQEAQSQEYYPQYGFSSYDIPLTLNGLAPEEQLENGQGVSWTPPRDVARLEEGDDPERDAREALCREIYGGVGFHDGSMCDAFLFLRAALDRATSLDQAGLAGAVRSLGQDYQSPMGVHTTFPGNHFYDGSDSVRLFDWMEACTTNDEGEEVGCYQYVTGPIPAPR